MPRGQGLLADGQARLREHPGHRLRRGPAVAGVREVVDPQLAVRRVVERALRLRLDLALVGELAERARRPRPRRRPSRGCSDPASAPRAGASSRRAGRARRGGRPRSACGGCPSAIWGAAANLVSRGGECEVTTGPGSSTRERQRTPSSARGGSTTPCSASAARVASDSTSCSVRSRAGSASKRSRSTAATAARSLPVDSRRPIMLRRAGSFRAPQRRSHAAMTDASST